LHIADENNKGKKEYIIEGIKKSSPSARGLTNRKKKEEEVNLSL
jgi:hypothetical protein